MRNCDIKFVNKEITPFGGLSLFFKMLEKCHFEEHVMQSGVIQPKMSMLSQPSLLSLRGG